MLEGLSKPRARRFRLLLTWHQGVSLGIQSTSIWPAGTKSRRHGVAATTHT